MRFIVVLIALTVGILTGFGLSWYSSASGTGFGASRVGPWMSWPKSGTVEADPYLRAMFARAGELPLGVADGIAFFADVDDNGTSLDGRCDIHIVGRLPLARFWTFTIYDSHGRLIDNVAGRYGFTSAEIVFRRDATLEILLAPRARSGNWLPTEGRNRITAVFRLYDAPVGTGVRSIDAIEMPSIQQESCP